MVWEKFLEIKSYTRTLVTIHKIFPLEMVEKVTDEFFSALPNTTFNELASSTDKMMREVEKMRPFIGESLWKLFFVYQAFITRIAWKVIEGESKKRLFSWDKDIDGEHDNHLFSLLKQIFSEEEILSLSNSVYAFETINNIFEIKVLEEMNQITLGRNFVNHTIDEYIRFAEISTTQIKNK